MVNEPETGMWIVGVYVSPCIGTIYPILLGFGGIHLIILSYIQVFLGEDTFMLMNLYSLLFDSVNLSQLAWEKKLCCCCS